jgi:hypothetical protein
MIGGLAFGCTQSTTAWTVKSRTKSCIHSMYIVSLDCIECWKQRPFFFSPKEMKCVVKFSCSLVGGTSSFQLLFLLVLLLFVSHLLEAIPVASILSLSSIHSSLQCAPGKPQQPPPLESFLEAASLVAFRNDGYVGVTPGLKAFPSCLIDNNALARTFLPGRAGTTLVPIPPPTYCCHCRH